MIFHAVGYLVFTSRGSVSEFKYLFRSITLGKQNNDDRAYLDPGIVGGEQFARDPLAVLISLL